MWMPAVWADDCDPKPACWRLETQFSAACWGCKVQKLDVPSAAIDAYAWKGAASFHDCSLSVDVSPLCTFTLCASSRGSEGRCTTSSHPRVPRHCPSASGVRGSPTAACRNPYGDVPLDRKRSPWAWRMENAGIIMCDCTAHPLLSDMPPGAPAQGFLPLKPFSL